MYEKYGYKVMEVGRCHYGIKISIKDSDFMFEEQYVSKYYSDGLYAAAKAIIDCYSKKNLDVVYNLYLFFKKHQLDVKWSGFKTKYLLEDTPEIAQFLEKIEKYKILE